MNQATGIHVVTPNPSIDVTYRAGRLTLGEANRIRKVRRVAGGKGLNVAKVLRRLGARTSVGGFLGGARAQEFLALIPELDAHFTLIDGELRDTFTIVDDAAATAYNEPGPRVGPGDWDRLTGHTADLLADRRGERRQVVAVSGSVPPGTPDGAYETFLRAVAAVGATVVADTSGPQLLEAARAGADVLKPNEPELLAATGVEDRDAAAAELLRLGAGCVVVSRGADGIEVHARRGPVLVGRVEIAVSGNAVGAGDALVAAIVRCIAGGSRTAAEMLLGAHDIPELVAVSAAAVLAEGPGEVDPEDVDRLRRHATVTKRAGRARDAWHARPDS